jgi:regulatory protein
LAGSAYQVALTLLARRELSTSQIRQRLARHGFDGNAVDEAVAQLTSERALDDARTAGAIARTALRLHRHGPSRVLRAIQAAGIPGDVARAAVDEAFEAEDVDALLRTVLDKRLPDGGVIADDSEMRRLFRYLVAQGFDPGRVVALLRSRRQ